MTQPLKPLPLEVDEDFRTRCDAVFRQWSSGNLPYKTAMDSLLQLELEGAKGSQVANQGYAENTIGLLYGYRADFDRSIRHFARARDLFERANKPDRVLGCMLNIGESYRQKGDFLRARQFFRTAFDQAIFFGDHAVAAISAANEGDLLLSQDQIDSARERFTKALEIITGSEVAERRRWQVIAQVKQGMVKVYVQQHDVASAWSCALESLEVARQADVPFLLGGAYRTMGEVLTALGNTPDNAPREQPNNPDPAATNETLGDPDMYFQLSIDQYRKISAEGEIARTIFLQGKSLLARGQKVTASRKFQQATLMFTKLGMKDDATKAAQAQMNSIED